MKKIIIGVLQCFPQDFVRLWIVKHSPSRGVGDLTPGRKKDLKSKLRHSNPFQGLD